MDTEEWIDRNAGVAECVADMSAMMGPAGRGCTWTALSGHHENEPSDLDVGGEG